MADTVSKSDYDLCDREKTLQRAIDAATCAKGAGDQAERGT